MCVCACVSHPSSTKEAFKLSRGARDRDRVVMTSSRKPTSNLRSSSCTELRTYFSITLCTHKIHQYVSIFLQISRLVQQTCFVTFNIHMFCWSIVLKGKSKYSLTCQQCFASAASFCESKFKTKTCCGMMCGVDFPSWGETISVVHTLHIIHRRIDVLTFFKKTKLLLICVLLFIYLIITRQNSSGIDGDRGFAENIVRWRSIWQRNKNKMKYVKNMLTIERLTFSCTLQHDRTWRDEVQLITFCLAFGL